MIIALGELFEARLMRGSSPRMTPMILTTRDNASPVSTILAMAFTAAGICHAIAQSGPLTGSAAFGDWRADKPGVIRLIKPRRFADAGATPSAANVSRVVPRPRASFRKCPPDLKSNCSPRD